MPSSFSNNLIQVECLQDISFYQKIQSHCQLEHTVAKESTKFHLGQFKHEKKEKEKKSDPT